jgi:hypothetical protein
MASSSSSYGNHVAIQGILFRPPQGNPELTFKALVGTGAVFVPLSAAAAIVRYDVAEEFATNFGPAAMGNLPRYAFRVTDSSIIHMLTGYETGPIGCQVLIAEAENERMARYLAGTDNPLYDFLEELRYNPNSAIGPVFKSAAERFTAATAAVVLSSPSSSTPQ